MEHISAIMGQLTESLQSQSIKISDDPEASNSLTTYKGELTVPVVIESVKLIKAAFPDLPAEFYDVFQARIKANGFTDGRLRDAVANVIDSCIYPKPTVAQFLSFDRRIKIFTYEQMLGKLKDYGEDIWRSYRAIKLSGLPKKVWIHINDVTAYNIKDEE